MIVFLTVWEFFIVTVEIVVGSGLNVSGKVPVGLMCAGSIWFLFSISTLKTNEYFSKIKLRYTKLRDWMNITILL